MFVKTDIEKHIAGDRLIRRASHLVQAGLLVLFVIHGSFSLAEQPEKYSADWATENRERQLQGLKKKIAAKQLTRRVSEARNRASTNSLDAQAWCDYGRAIVELSGSGLDVKTLLKAEEPFNRAIELNPDSAESQYWFGKYWMDLGRVSRDDLEQSLGLYEEARRHLERSRKLDPKNQRTEKQLKLLDRYVARRSQLISAMDRDGSARRRIANEIQKNKASASRNDMDPKECTKSDAEPADLKSERDARLLALERGVLNDLDDVQARIRYGKALHRAYVAKPSDHYLEKMRREIDALLEKDKSNGVALSLLGDYHQAKGEVEAAVDLYARALKSESTEPPIEALEGLWRIDARRPLDERLANAGNKQARLRLKHIGRAKELLDAFPNYKEMIRDYHQERVKAERAISGQGRGGGHSPQDAQ